MIKNLSFALLITISFNANAWWDKAHRMVCDEAYKLLSVPAKKFVDPLIKEHGSYGTACLWADWVKNEDRQNTRSWHYINLPDSEQNTYKASCPENGCLIYAFHKQIKVLNNRSKSFRERAEAVWFIGHFVGDVHQPMHAGYPEDRGGNDHKLKFPDGTSTNMHSVWDGQIIEHMDSLFGEQYLLKNVSRKIGKFINNPQSTEFESWAQESRDIAMQGSVGYRNNELKIVTNEYMENHFEIVQERIALGAIRLSQILNRIYQQGD
ncbi:S1/P1 nuclease [Pseudomonadota bacterium]|nr:S1/P1 nuclease [Pseudomonadota bacterium]MDC0198766.1 S1/P1 nuclease [Pseudomonadota bacterium]|tara:strand:- start:595 stop:1389 length:795 start_codon:yes stop_codon:yes gene_type:complete